MNIYEVIALREANVPAGAVVQAMPGVNPSAYRVTYPDELGKLPDVVAGEDAARQRYSDEVDKWNANSKQRKKEEAARNKQQARNRRERAREAKARAKADLQGNGATQLKTRGLNFLKPLSRIAGITVLTMELNEQLMDQMIRAYRTFANSEGDPIIAEQIYTLTAHRIFGLWISSVSLATAVGIRRMVQLGRTANMIRAIRAANLATSLATFFTGPLSIMKFVLVEGAMWAVIWYIKNSEAGQRNVAEFLVSNKITGTVLGYLADGFQLSANGLEKAVNDYAGLDSDTVTTALGDLKNTLGMSQADIAAATADADKDLPDVNAYRNPDQAQDGSASSGGTSVPGGVNLNDL